MIAAVRDVAAVYGVELQVQPLKRVYLHVGFTSVFNSKEIDSYASKEIDWNAPLVIIIVLK